MFNLGCYVILVVIAIEIVVIGYGCYEKLKNIERYTKDIRDKIK